MSSWNSRTDEQRAARVRPAVNQPDPCSPEEYEAKLWQATERSLRQDPGRWVVGANGTQPFAARGQDHAPGGDDDDYSIGSARRSRVALAAWERRRTARYVSHQPQ